MVASAEKTQLIQTLVHNALHQRCLSRQDHLKLTSAILSDPTLTPSDRRHVNRLLDYVRMGKVRLTD